MTLELEDRLWEQLEAAAEREAGRGRVDRRIATARTMRPRVAPATLAVLAALVLAVVVAGTLHRQAPPVTPSPPRIDVFHVTGNRLTGAAGGFGALWTYDTKTQTVLRIDPASGRVLARVPVPAVWPDVTLADSTDAIWAVSTHDVGHDAAPAHPPAATLFRIDPHGNRIAGRIELRAPDGSTLIPTGLFATPGAIWVWGENGAQRIDPATNGITAAVHVPGGRIKAFTANENEAWASTDLGDLVRFNARTGKRLSTVVALSLFRPEQPIALPGALLIDRQDGSIAAIDGTTGVTRWTAHLGTGTRGATFANGRLWLLSTEALVLVDTYRHQIVERLKFPQADPIAVAAVGSTLLVTTSNGDVIAVEP